ncbi:MAG: adenylate kinase [Candidatus Pelagibacter sp. TMED128]|nr:MAG: adenylate kinase [Candidatus Pelagibacter sp. TMED128]|tara:strand:+ start:25 stop:591 length:567 start_codon:yes stop_codon:yes gene_type:complete
MNLIIFGPPGAGKGTQADFIVNKYDLYQLSTGEVLRNEIKNKTDLGNEISSIINSGSLVSDNIVKKLVEIFISDKRYKDRLIFDGYPRNLIQAETLQELLNKYGQKIDLVLKLSVSLETIKKRILERSTLEKRADDSEQIAIKRYKTYEKSTEPVIEYYKKLNLLKVIDGERPIELINKEISDIISLI